MQIQANNVASRSLPVTGSLVRTRVVPIKSQAFSSVCTSFVAGTALRARPLRTVSSRRGTQVARADVFFTQKTVPDQTGRVAIVTGEPWTAQQLFVSCCDSDQN